MKITRLLPVKQRRSSTVHRRLPRRSRRTWRGGPEPQASGRRPSQTADNLAFLADFFPQLARRTPKSVASLHRHHSRQCGESYPTISTGLHAAAYHYAAARTSDGTLSACPGVDPEQRENTNHHAFGPATRHAARSASSKAKVRCDRPENRHGWISRRALLGAKFKRRSTWPPIAARSARTARRALIAEHELLLHLRPRPRLRCIWPR